MSQWKEYKLGETLVSANTGLDAIKRAPIVERDTGIKCLRIQDISQSKSYEKWGFTEVTENNYFKFQLIKNDIIVARTGATVGVNMLIEETLKAVFNNGLIRLRAKGNFNSKFIYYLLRTSNYWEHINGIAYGTTSQPNIQINQLLEFNISIPPLPTQTAIASILSSLDEKIELNNAINRNLEALAQALFKQWFVDFNFPVDEHGNFSPLSGEMSEGQRGYKDSGGEMIDSELGMIPKGWRVYSIGEILETISKTYPLKKVNEVIFLNTGDISEGNFLHSDKSDSSKLPGQAKKSIQKNDILYSEIRPANKRYAFVYFNTDEYVVSTKLMVLRPKVEINPLFPYFILTQQVTLDYLQQLAETRSGTFPQITFTELSTVKFAAKGLDFINEFTSRVLVYRYELQFQTKSENSNLIKLRDTLLPKLISGELEVKDDSLTLE